MSYHEGSNWQARKEDEGKPLYENENKKTPTKDQYKQPEVSKVKSKEEILNKAFIKMKGRSVDAQRRKIISDAMEEYRNQSQQPEQGMKWVLGEDDPFPLKEVLRIFINAANTLLHKKDYDGPDYEELEICIMRGKEIIKLLDESPNEHDAND